MLLQRLSDYADQIGMPPPLYQEKYVRYLILLDAGGHYLQLIDCASEQRRQGILLLVPESKRSVNVKPFLLADNAAYVLGIARREGEVQRVHRMHLAFLALVHQCAQETREPRVQAVAHFLETLSVAALDLPSDFDPAARLTFEVDGVRPIDLEIVRDYWARIAAAGDAEQVMQCLVCGNMRSPVERLPIPIRGIPGGQPTGMALISANERVYESYGLSASLIAPTCEDCGLRFSNALNALLRDKETHLTVSLLAYIFWAKEPLSFSLASLLSQPSSEDVQQVLRAAWKGRPEATQADTTPFYAACLSARGPRIVVRDWMETTLGSVQRHLARYFALQRIVDSTGQERWFSLWQLVNATVRRDSQEEAIPQVGQALLHLALSGGALPVSLLHQVVHRIRAEHHVQPAQASLIKMVLLSQRDGSTQDLATPGEGTQHEREKHDMAELDPTDDTPAYLCGRLLAVLEAIQYVALGDISATIIERYYGTASSAPASVFGRLLRGAQYHLAKMRGDKSKQGAAIRLDRDLQDILAGFEAYGKRFPPTLNMIEQGIFAIGYYNQRTFDRRAARAAAERKAAAKQLVDTSSTNGDLAGEEEAPIAGSNTQEEIQ